MRDVGLALGNWYSYPGMTVNDMTECAVRADELGYHSLWTVELFRDAFSPLMSFAARTKKIRLGTGIVNIYARSPLVTVWEITTLDEFSEQRAILGVGVGREAINIPWHSSSFNQPFQAMRDYVQIIGQTLSKGKCNYDGNVFSVKNYNLRFKPSRASIPIFVAAMGPKMIEVAAEIGDGVILFPFSVDYVRNIAIKKIANGIKRRRAKNRPQIASYLPACVSKEKQKAIKAARKLAASYMALPYFAEVIAQAIDKHLVSKVGKLWSQGDIQGALSHVDSSIAERLIICGTPEECRTRIDAFRKEGIQLPILYPREVGTDLKADIMYCIENCGE